MPRAPQWAPALVLAVAAMVLGGCRLALVAEATVDRDGSGTAALAVTLGPALLAELDRLGIDPTAELSAAAPLAPDWDVDRETSEDGSLVVTLSRDAEDPAALAAAFRELTAGLSDADPALEVDLDVEVDGEGATRLSGRAGLRPPATAGATRDGTPVGPAGDDLAALVAEAVHARLVVTLPGPVVDHDADALDGTTLTWRLPVGADRPVAAVSTAPPQVPAPVIAVAGGVVALTAAALVWWWRRRRRAAVTRAG